MYRFWLLTILWFAVRVHGQQGQQQGQQGQQGQQQGQRGQGGGPPATAGNRDGGGGQGGARDGVCPRPNNPPGPCTVLCQEDRRCGPGFKCCDTGCGRVCRRAVPAAGAGQRGPQQGQQQQQLPPQPSLVGLGGCSRGATLRNPDGSTLVCGFGPRDFACPTNFACVFDSILRALVCCPSDESTSPPTPSPPNPCPDGEPLKDEFNNHLQCSNSNGAAGGVGNCPTGTLCTGGVCCRPQSVAGFLSIKPGQCPLPLPIAQSGTCANECSFDAECQGALKCCFSGCGARCVQVAADASGGGGSGSLAALGAGPPGSAGAGVGVNSQQSPPFDLAPTRNDGLFLQQQGQQQRPNGFIPQSGGFLGDQQGGGFAAGRSPTGFGGGGGQQQQRGGIGGGGGAQQFQSSSGGLSGRAQKDFASKSESFAKPISGTLFRPGVSPMTANDTCENTACPTCHECSEAAGAAHCIRMPDCCPDGSTPLACHTNPCPQTKCSDNPEAFCFPDGCSNVCRAVYYDRMGNAAPCPTASNL